MQTRALIEAMGHQTVTMALGIGLTLAANMLHLGASYFIMADQHIQPLDFLLSRALTQTWAFGLWSLVQETTLLKQSFKYQRKFAPICTDSPAKQEILKNCYSCRGK